MHIFLYFFYWFTLGALSSVCALSAFVPTSSTIDICTVGIESCIAPTWRNYHCSLSSGFAGLARTCAYTGSAIIITYVTVVLLMDMVVSWGTGAMRGIILSICPWYTCFTFSTSTFWARMFCITWFVWTWTGLDRILG